MKSVCYIMGEGRGGGKIRTKLELDNEICLVFFFLFFTIFKESGYYNDYVESSAESSERYLFFLVSYKYSVLLYTVVFVFVFL